MCEHDYSESTVCPWCISVEVMPLQEDEERVAGYHPDLAAKSLVSATERDKLGRLKKWEG